MVIWASSEIRIESPAKWQVGPRHNDRGAALLKTHAMGQIEHFDEGRDVQQLA